MTTSFYQIVYDVKGNAVAFIVVQDTPRSASYCSMQVSLEALKSRVGNVLPSVSLTQRIQKRVRCIDDR